LLFGHIIILVHITNRARVHAAKGKAAVTTILKCMHAA
jgi:hypothetical protein